MMGSALLMRMRAEKRNSQCSPNRLSFAFTPCSLLLSVFSAYREFVNFSDVERPLSNDGANARQARRRNTRVCHDRVRHLAQARGAKN